MSAKWAVTINTESDLAFMRYALRLAARGLGRTWPNPTVGCVLAKDGHVVGAGRTADGGRPHAETIAIAQAGSAAKGATAYVTLEPCSHYGGTPPCAEALIAAGISRVVVASGDPDARVCGAGFALLRTAGLSLEEGLLKSEAVALNEGFFKRVELGRPMVTVKLATSLDGKIATASGESKWITGDAARAHGHYLRATHDAILVGIGTALADDPELTCRLPGLRERSPVRIVLDQSLRLDLSSKLIQSADRTPLWILHRGDAPLDRRDVLLKQKTQLIEVSVREGTLDISAALKSLGNLGITRLLVEGGTQVVSSLLRADLVDYINWYRAGSLLGNDSLAAIGALGYSNLTNRPQFRRVGMRELGQDIVESWARDR